MFYIDKKKNCSARNVKLDKDNYKKDKTICKKCYNESKRKNKSKNNLIQSQQAKSHNVNTNKNNRTVLVGCSFSGKTYLMLKVLSRIPPDRDIYIITKSPAEQYSNSKIKIK